VSPEEVLQLYAGQDVTPTRLTADAVLAGARARVRRGRVRAVAFAGVATVLVLAGVAFALPSRHDRSLPTGPPSGSPSVSATREWPPAVKSPAPPLTCTPSALPEMAGTTPEARAVSAIDPSGTWIVGTSRIGLLVWRDGKVSNPSAGRMFVPNAVNAAGVIAGFEVVGDKGRAAALFRDGRVTRLPQPPDTTRGEATAVDAHGNALGTVRSGTDGGYVSVLWPAGGGMITIAAPPGMNSGSGAALGDGGTVIGKVLDGDNRSRLYRWNPDGTGAVLDGPVTEPSRVAGDWVTGGGMVGADRAYHESPRPSGAVRHVYSSHVRWNMRTGTADAMGEFQTIALTADGWAFGVRDFQDFRPAVWRDGTVTILPLRNPARDEIEFGGISADGRTIVASTRAVRDGPMDITRWSC
jgi:hypothetical protein